MEARETTRQHGIHHLEKLYNVTNSSSLYFLLISLGASPHGVQLATILKLIKEEVLKGSHFDRRNPSIIMCQRSQQLENVFAMKALHVSQVQSALDPSISLLDNSSDSDSESSEAESTTSPTTPTEVTATEPEARNIPEIKYSLSPKLRGLLSKAGLIKSQILFTYLKASALLSKYIISRKNHIFDTRNILVALVNQDPLGEVFEVSAFHRSQASTFLKKHLFPVSKSVATQTTDWLKAEVKVEMKEEVKEEVKEDQCRTSENAPKQVEETAPNLVDKNAPMLDEMTRRSLKRCADDCT